MHVGHIIRVVLPQQRAGHAVEAEACSNNIPPGEDAATPSLPQGGQTVVVDNEARPQSTGAIHPAADTTTPPEERGSSATKRLKQFAAKILRKMSSPLLPQSDVEEQPKLPTRLRRFHSSRLRSGERCW